MNDESEVEAGTIAPEIDLPMCDPALSSGARWRLADARGRPVVLIFHRHLH